MRNTLAITGVIMIALLFSACGGGGGGGGGGGTTAAPSGTTPVTLYHPSGRIAAQGFYTTGTTTRVGTWAEYFDLDGSPKQWDRSYANGVWNESVAWREFNADGSTRDDWTDR
jgi:hypothetical protein